MDTSAVGICRSWRLAKIAIDYLMGAIPGKRRIGGIKMLMLSRGNGTI